MKQFVSILRGINVGGKRKILMKELRACYEAKDLSNVRTYIQSGNAVFEYGGNKDTNQLEELLFKTILQTFGHEVPVIVRSKVEWTELIKNNPYAGEDINHLHITFLKSTPDTKAQQSLIECNYGDNQISFSDNNLYMHIKGVYHQTKLTHRLIEKTLETNATTRNWKTVLKIRDLLCQ